MFHLLKDGIRNSFGDGLGEHVIEWLVFSNITIMSTSGQCVCNVGGGDWLIFGDITASGIASSGDGEDAVRRNGIPFHLLCLNGKNDDEWREYFDFDVPPFVKRRTGIGLGSRPVSGGKFQWRVWIVSIEQGCVSGLRHWGRSDTCVHVGNGLTKYRQGGGNGWRKSHHHLLIATIIAKGTKIILKR